MADDNAPEPAPTVLLLIDVINDLAFDGGDKLLRYARPMARHLAALADRARDAGVPVIYVNDNFGRWRSDFKAQVRHCLGDGVRGEPVARLLQPRPMDYFVLKPMNSAFFATALETLLDSLGAERLILTGLAGDNCVLFTAHDAHMRRYELSIPANCIASETLAGNRWALRHMERVLHADLSAGAEVKFRPEP